jgi:hypothetical protein
MAMTGLLAFGAGILVANAFDDDYDDYHGGYYPHYHGHPVPYHPPYPYRPTYGNGFYPGHHYAPPPGYRSNNNAVVINHNTNYWNSFNKSAATRSELTTLNAAPTTRATAAQPQSWKGQSTYAGATRSARSQVSRELPKIQGSYAGTAATASQARASAPSANYARPNARVSPSPNTRTADATVRSRAARETMQAGVAHPSGATALSAETGGVVDRAASQRGRQSMPNGVPVSARSAGRPARR